MIPIHHIKVIEGRDHNSVEIALGDSSQMMVEKGCTTESYDDSPGGGFCTKKPPHSLRSFCVN